MNIKEEDREAYALSVLKILNIPIIQNGGWAFINIIDLARTLLDEDKMKEINSKLKNKAFW